MFSIKKCKDTQCKYHLPPVLDEELFDSLHHLPDPIPSGERYMYISIVAYVLNCQDALYDIVCDSLLRYKPFSEVYGSETTEKHRPSLLATRGSASGHGMPFNPTKQTALNVDVSLKTHAMVTGFSS
jgi:hypothetical protein